VIVLSVTEAKFDPSDLVIYSKSFVHGTKLEHVEMMILVCLICLMKATAHSHPLNVISTQFLRCFELSMKSGGTPTTDMSINQNKLD